MVDITKCQGDQCPLKETCYRFTSKPCIYAQSYFGNIPYNNSRKECDYYWKNPRMGSKEKSYKEVGNGID